MNLKALIKATETSLNRVRKLSTNFDPDITFRNLGLHGRFGNQLWQIFSTLGIGLTNGKNAKFGEWLYSAFFSFPESFWQTPNWWTPNSTSFTPHLGKQAIYLQDFSLLPKDKEMIKEYLIPNNFFQSKIDEISRKYSIANRHAVHIRRGDYLSSSEYHTVPGLDWYASGLRDNSLIFTDDMSWCAREFPGIERVSENDIFSWILMSKCESFLISASSYSWWAAFVSDSTDVTYPDPWSPQKLEEWNTNLFLPNYFKPKKIQ